MLNEYKMAGEEATLDKVINIAVPIIILIIMPLFWIWKHYGDEIQNLFGKISEKLKPKNKVQMEEYIDFG